jgi:hypothetical protein
MLNAGSMPLVVGTVLALAALALVLWPLVQVMDGADASTTMQRPTRALLPEDRPATAVDALREIEFDRATGKLSDHDYTELKQRYTRDALHELRAADARSAAARSASMAAPDQAIDASVVVALTEDPVERAIQRARANQRECTVCGPRPEPDACYCGSCGRYLPGECGRCGHLIDLVGSRFCSGCGEQLAAA